MKLCPSCGAELDDEVTKCSICDHIFEKAVQIDERPGVADTDVTRKLEEMKAKIAQLAKGGASEPSPVEQQIEPPIIPSPSPPREKEETSEEPVEQTVPAPLESEEGVEEEETVEYEEVEVGEAEPVIHGTVGGQGFPSVDQQKTPGPEKVAYKITAADTKKSGISRRQWITAIIVVIILVIASWFVLMSRPSTETPNVDGTFGEWSEIVKYSSYYQSSDPDLKFTECAVQSYQSSIYWYLKTSGDLYKTSDHITTYALFVDSDGDPGTGFPLIRDFGADFVAQISGTGGQKLSEGCELLQFSGTDAFNYSSWVFVQTLAIGKINNQAETSFVAPGSLSIATARFLAVSYDGVATPSATLPFALKPGILMIEQSSVVDASCTIPIGAASPVLKVVVKAFGGRFETAEIHPTFTGIAQTENLGPLVWSDGNEMLQGRTFNVAANTSGSTPGTFITATMSLDGVVTEYGSVAILGETAKGYVNSYPTGIKIDGCFADWTTFVNDLGDIMPVVNDNIDIRKISHESDSTTAYFYLDAMGAMMNGSLIPVVKKQLLPDGGSGGSGGPQKHITGEDVLQVYMDIDPTADSGAPSPSNGTSIRPDYMIDVRGRNSVIDSKVLMRWVGGQWVPLPQTAINVGNDAHKIELSLVKSYIVNSTLNNSDIVFVMSDWSGTSDNFTESGIVIDPFKVNLTGKIWGSLDGTTWTSKSDVLSGGNSLVDMTSDSGSNLYAIFSNGTVFKSGDAAVSWTRIVQGTLTGVVGITSDRASELYILLSNGSSYISPATGGSWAWRGKSPPPASSYVDIDWSSGTVPSSTVLYATKSTPNWNIYKTSDGGLTWVMLAGKLPTDSTVAAINAHPSGLNELIYALEVDGDVRVSNDSGVSWTGTHISTGGSADFTSDPCVDIDTDTLGNIWVVRSKGEVYLLTVSPWGWQTLFSAQDSNDIQAFSTAPIPEFGASSMLFAVFMIIPIVFFIRRRGARR
jgi:hypothetical protein